MEFTLYILQSAKDNSYYIGFKSDLTQRLGYHNSRKSRYTSKKMHCQVVYTENFKTPSEAMKSEKFLKKQRKREFDWRLNDKTK